NGMARLWDDLPSRSSKRSSRKASLHPLHEAIHHALLAGFVELDAELVAVHRGDIAIAELEVEHAVADREGGNRAGRAGDQLTFDGERRARPRRPFPCIGPRLVH